MSTQLPQVSPFSTKMATKVRINPPSSPFSSTPLCSGRYGELQSEFASAVQTSVEQKALILKLEHDLGTIQAMSSLPRPDAEGSEVGTMENIPEPIKEATAMFAGVTARNRTSNATTQYLVSRLCGFLKRPCACVLGRSQHRAPAGPDGLAALNHLQPTGEIPLSQPGAGSGEWPPGSGSSAWSLR